MTGRGSESAIPCNQRRAELLRKHDVGCIIAGQILSQQPNPGQQHKVRIAGDPEVLQIVDRLTCPVR